jgi:hypothetical protein
MDIDDPYIVVFGNIILVVMVKVYIIECNKI